MAIDLQKLTLRRLLDTQSNDLYSKLLNQYSYYISNKKFSNKAIKLKSNIKDDVKETLKIFGKINHEIKFNK